MSRYFMYNIIMIGLLNIVMFVPHKLIESRFNGAVPSMIIAGILGTLMSYFFTNILARHPGKGGPEIIKEHLPRFISMPLLTYLSLVWFFGASISLINFAILVNRFLNPDIKTWVVLLVLIFVCIYGASRSTLSVLFFLEISILVTLPFIAFILLKALQSEDMNWDAIRVTTMYVTTTPNITTIASASYIFSGFLNFAIFNRIIPSNSRLRWRWLVPVFGYTILGISFFVPIGFHGTIGAADYLYVWTVTSDSLIMNYGFVERVLFLYITVFLVLTLIATIVIWHLAMETFKSAYSSLTPDIDPIEQPKENYWICGAFGVVTLFVMIMFNEKQNLMLSKYWMTLFFFTQICVVVLFMIVGRKGSKTL